MNTKGYLVWKSWGQAGDKSKLLCFCRVRPRTMSPSATVSEKANPGVFDFYSNPYYTMCYEYYIPH